MSITSQRPSPNPLAWQATLAASAVLGTLATACMMPFVAVAVATAATMPRRHAAATVIAVWFVNQLLGFTLLGYPPTPSTVAWGAALGGASLLAMGVASRLLDRPRANALLFVTTFLAAFIAYEGALFAFALFAGGTGTFTAPIVLQILTNDACWCAALVALHYVLTRAAPQTFGPALMIRAA